MEARLPECGRPRPVQIGIGIAGEAEKRRGFYIRKGLLPLLPVTPDVDRPSTFQARFSDRAGRCARAFGLGEVGFDCCQACWRTGIRLQLRRIGGRAVAGARPARIRRVVRRCRGSRRVGGARRCRAGCRRPLRCGGGGSSGGKLSKDDKKALEEWLKLRWKRDSQCFVCNENHWLISEHMVAPVSSGHQGGFSIGGPQYPQVMLICNNCGNSLYFNAVLIGVARDTEEKQGGTSDGEK